jgi:hypothetical protein
VKEQCIEEGTGVLQGKNVGERGLSWGLWSELDLRRGRGILATKGLEVRRSRLVVGREFKN